jgi:hypothetical protein
MSGAKSDWQQRNLCGLAICLHIVGHQTLKKRTSKESVESPAIYGLDCYVGSKCKRVFIMAYRLKGSSKFVWTNERNYYFFHLLSESLVI